ncbi:MAG: hypothetical protein ACD_7C00099G0005 [uncultured bacterium]|nr:MAG: hypothetical protein ACD_7C00099G0005 [uncultured bacterium]KKP68823.1 MAG: hypothetical protein UR66_C0003G0088 [Candidatus Moranbacteria bacterium GW2011_GWE1_35_17]KKP71668.1 MAG: hypothetical protein UR65_C0028G0005 [Candidatus Moranbacteria bacterium GW2011_GWE2_35_164]KKP81610.1 MAG: hypothetical protein UR82_C0056G0010 [Candidatus Moranbacteria bacterium GW2011_GWF1_35_5]KKP84370.1 MAG: hypothetical protein UR83_C0022G0007 [Candidatus Moranbacteria bacterium GW2011_GWF2_35_54]
MLYIKILSYLFIFSFFPFISIPGGWTSLFFFAPFIYLPGLFLTAFVLITFEKVNNDIAAKKMLLKMITTYILGCLLFVDGGDGNSYIGIDAFVNRVIFHNFSSVNIIRVVPEYLHIFGLASFGLLIYFIIWNISFIQKFKVKNIKIQDSSNF